MTDHYAPLRDLLQVWRDELPYKGSQWEERHDHIKDCADELERALEEVALLPFDSDLVRDAERYRWLKARVMSANFEPEDCVELTFELPAGSTIWACTDRTIDAAIHAQAGGSES
jgi:hypothetical protein